jgi:hypothetical protein
LSWRADAVITLDDVAITTFASTEDETLRRLSEKAISTWEARVDRQRSLKPSLRDHIRASRPEDVYLNEPWLSIHWDSERKYVHADFKGFANSEEFRASTMKIVGAIRERGAEAMVSDNRELEGVTESDQEWLRDTWMPEAVNAGVRRIAVVLAHHGKGKVASESIIARFGKTEFVTRTFESLPAAVDWAADREGGARLN